MQAQFVPELMCEYSVFRSSSNNNPKKGNKPQPQEPPHQAGHAWGVIDVEAVDHGAGNNGVPNKVVKIRQVC